MSTARRLVILVVAVLVCAGVGTGFVLHAADQAAQRSRPTAGGPAVSSGEVSLGPGAAKKLLFLNTAAGPDLDRLSSVPIGDTAGPRTATGTTCLRFYAAAGTGVCLQSATGVLGQTTRAVILDARLKTLRSYPIAGIPSRARVSPSGRLVAWTDFVGGDSYGSAFFSTRTSILDTRTWKVVDSLEQFSVQLNGKPYHATDDNFWGVTFASDDDTFYATLGTAGRTYLMRGSLSKHSATGVGVENVECPSLSPDGTRIAFKKRVLPNAALWREYVIDLRTLKETPLAEPHSVDDQATWLDDDTIAYALPTDGDTRSTDLWSVPADGSGKPKLIVPGAFSPAPQ
ncbi:TolB family protein [Streptacidiphilus carbonis]|uniref:TolB family protein n=1 Tax=Streptacidiphilus carbonis TaxID=105422 RepID=UPI0005A70D65|nr:PD40 domain-containing protein [Streptacidiphilus carbonis]